MAVLGVMEASLALAVPPAAIAHEEPLAFHVAKNVPCNGAIGCATGWFVVSAHIHRPWRATSVHATDANDRRFPDTRHQAACVERASHNLGELR
jgi:hypothetical protein